MTLDTRTDLAILTEVDPAFDDLFLPLTGHMGQVWHRFDLQQRHHLNSTASRLEFAVWYFYHFLPGRPILLPPLSLRMAQALNAPVDAAVPMTRFLLSLWRAEFRHDPAFDIYDAAGGERFLSLLLVEVFPNRGLPPELLPDAARAVARRGVIRVDALEVNAAQRWKRDSAEVYRRKYPRLEEAATLQAFTFDLLVHHFIDHPEAGLIPDRMLEYWAAPALPLVPQLSRFVIACAFCAARFGAELTDPARLPVLADAIADWFRTEVLAAYPQLGALAGPLAPGGARAVAVAHRVARDAARLRGLAVPARPRDAMRTTDLLVVGPFGAASGLGTGMRRSVDALHAAACDFRVLNLRYDNPSAEMFEVEGGHAYRGEVPRAVLWHYNAEYLQDVVSMLPELTAAYNIGYFFWETEALPEAHRLSCRLVDEIWAPSEFVAECYRRSGNPLVFNVGTAVAPPRVGDAAAMRANFAAPDDTLFMFSFDAHSVIHRKNPAAVVRAFLLAFPTGAEKVRLVLKTQNLTDAHWGAVKGRGEELVELCARDPRITIHNRTMPLEDLHALKAGCDCYVSLHRSEGFGYGPAEAMALGKPVITTGYSANLEFCDPTTAFLVDAPLVPMEAGEYLYRTADMVWADPDIAHAARCMRAVVADPAAARAMGGRARTRILTEFGVDALAARYARRLRELGLLAADPIATRDAA